MNNFRYKLQQFMYGRYGYDELGRAMAILMIVLCVIFLFLRSKILNAALWVLLIYNVYRVFSKNIVARRLENDKYLRVVKPYQLQWQFRKTHIVYRCKNCGQIVRVPRGKGKVDVTCPKCKTVTTKRT